MNLMSKKPDTLWPEDQAVVDALPVCLDAPASNINSE